MLYTGNRRVQLVLNNSKQLFFLPSERKLEFITKVSGRLLTCLTIDKNSHCLFEANIKQLYQMDTFIFSGIQSETTTSHWKYSRYPGENH